MTAIFDRASKDLAALDFSKENAAIAAIQAEGERFTAGILKAEVRIAEITARLSELLQEKHAAKADARAVADALLSDAGAEQAAAMAVTERDLREELAALRAGMRDLQDRSRECSDEIARIKGTASERLVKVLMPAIDAITVEAKAAANTIAHSFATLAAINGATRQFHREADNIGDALARLMSSRLIDRKNALDAPEAVQELLAPLSALGVAVAGHVPKYVTVPNDNSVMAAIAGMTARAAVG